MENQTFLGITTGTRTMGIAVLHNGNLTEWKMLTFKGQWSTKKLKGIIKSLILLIEAYKPSHAVLKEVDSIRASAGLMQLHGEMLKTLNALNIPTSSFSIQKIKKAHAEESIDLNFKRNYSNQYYKKMFEAITLVYIHDRNKKRRT